MTKNATPQLINEHDYYNVIESLVNSYESRNRLITTPSRQTHNHQKLMHMDQILKEIKKLIRQENLQINIVFDEDYQLKVRHQIIFINMLNIAINALLETEALDSKIKALQDTENYLRFKDLDEKNIKNLN